MIALAVDRRWWSAGDDEPLEVGFVCTAGARGKCIRIGYYPWLVDEASGESIARYHQACVHMMRADYCGDGHPYTRAGTAVAWIDRLGRFGEWPRRNLRDEAVWGPDGAICVGRTRHEDLVARETLLERCPRLAAAPARCDESMLGTVDDALLVNRS